MEDPKREPTKHQPTITVFRKKSFATLHRIRAGSPAELRDVLLAETYLGRWGEAKNHRKGIGSWESKHWVNHRKEKQIDKCILFEAFMIKLHIDGYMRLKLGSFVFRWDDFLCLMVTYLVSMDLSSRFGCFCCESVRCKAKLQPTIDLPCQVSTGGG